MGEVELPSWLKALPQAPEFHPTEAEFVDPVAYILKIEEEAKQYGICKIIPPFTKASKKVVVNNLNRSLSISTEALASAVHGSSAHPMSRSMGGVTLNAELSKPKGLVLDASCTDSTSKAKFATRRQQLGWNPKRARGVAHSQNHKLVWQSGESYSLEQFEQKAKMFSRQRLGTWKDVSPLAVESLFWRAAAEKPISIEYANDIPGSAFADPARLRKRKRALEDAAEQVNLDSIFVGCQSEEKVQEDETGEEIDPSDAGKSGGDNVGGAGSKLANSAWNMRGMARSQGSLLQFMPEEVPGVTSPMVYIGMLFSWFAWHVEDHELHSLNYLHMGASKTWYAVPGDAAPALEEAIRVHGYGGHLNPRAAFSLLGEKTTVMSPEVLVAAGVPCCRLVQNAGEYVVTFPRAYHLGFSHGFNCGEAANFATPGWLEVAKEAAARRAAMNYLPMLSHQQLLYLLTMSLPPRLSASAPSEPRSSRLKVRKKSVGEEMVKSMFVQDAVHNNALLRILLDNGVSRCLLAKDGAHRSSMKTMSEGSKLMGPVPPMDDLERALISELSSQGGEASQFPCHGASNAEETVDNHFRRQSPSCTPVPSGGQDAVFEGLSIGSFGEIKLSCRSTDPLASSNKSAIGELPQEFGESPIRSKNQKETASLAIDWGTLPCAACGILCYATMAVVEPSVTAAMTFKPIYAAAGLGHCAFEAHEAGRMTKYIPTLPYPRSSTVAEISDDLYVNSLQIAYADGRSKQDQPGLVELCSATLRQSGASEVNAQCALSTENGYHFNRLITQPSEVVEGSRPISPTFHYDRKPRPLGYPTSQTSDMCFETEMKAGRFTALVNMDSVAVDRATKLSPAPLNPECFRSRSHGSYVHSRDSHHATLEPLAPLSLCQTTDSKLSSILFEQPLENPLQPRLTNKINDVMVDGRTYAAEICGELDGQQRVLFPQQQVVSSLQLLASTYDESSDLEEENVVETAEGCDGCIVEHNGVDEAAEVCESFAKPDVGVGDLLTDVVGLSADVPWLSLVPPTEPTDLPPLTSKAPLFTFTSLIEGPKSLGKVFISGGFSFMEDDTADPASLGSSLTEERTGKQSSEVTSVDGDLNNQTNDVHCGKVMDMLDLYHRINSQALTVDLDEDEQLMIDFGLRRPRATCLPESFDVEECQNDRAEQAASLHQLEARSQAFKHLNLTSDAPSSLTLTVDNPSCPVPSYMVMTTEFPLKENGTCYPTAKTMQSSSAGRLNEDSSVGGRMSMAFIQDGVAGPQQKDPIPETFPRISHERKLTASEACETVARPRVLCLEHAVEAQERLRSVGGANILIVCHSDFDDYEHRAKHLIEEFDVEHTWRHIPFIEGTDDEVRLVSTAVDVEDEGRGVNDWVMQMGLFVHRFKERESESSDDDQNPSEDFRAGPFSRMNQGKASRNRLMAGRLGLSRKSEDNCRSHSGVSPQITVRYSRRVPKTSKKKKATVAGKWCGKVWRVNQVHPFLGGCRKVDPSLQLGMPSTSLYALSMMSDCDGGRPRRGMPASRIEASPNSHLIPDRNTDEQQSIAVRNRGRKRKTLEQGMNFQQDNVNEGHKNSPKHGRLAESRDGSECLDGTIDGSEEVFTAGECQGQLMLQVSPSVANQSDADPTAQSSKSDVINPCGPQLLSPIPLPSHHPSEPDDGINGLNDKSTESKALVGESECCGSIDKTKTILSATMSLPSVSRPVTDMNAFEFRRAPSPISLKSIQTKAGKTPEDVDGWHKTSSLSNVYSALPYLGRAVKSRNEFNSSPVSKSISMDGNRISAAGSAALCVWRDVPVISSRSLQSLATPFTGGFTSQIPLPSPKSIHGHLYIPNVSVTTNEALSDHTMVSQTSHDELYSGSSKTFGSYEQGGGKLQEVHLLQVENVGHISEGGAAEARLDSEYHKVSSKSPPGPLILYTEMDTSVQHVASSELVAVNGKQDSHMRAVYLRDGVLDPIEGVIPSLLERVLGTNEEDCRPRSCDSPDCPQGISEHLVCENGGPQQRLQDIKNVVRLPDGMEKFATEVAEGLANAGHLRAHHTDAGQSTSNDSDSAHLQDAQNCHFYDSKQPVELTPVLSIAPSLMEDGALVVSGDLRFGDATEGSALEHPMENLLPLRSSSRGRSIVKARGKRPKHVGWKNYKPAQSGIPGETALDDWVHETHSHLSAPVVVTLEAKECVEARFEVEDCDKVLEISPTCPISSLGLNQLTTEEDENDEESCESEKVVVKSKKKTKPKKKKVPSGKPAVGEGEFQCDIEGCRMTFPTESDLKIHKNNRCTFKGCGKRFFMHKYLLQHRRVHLDERPLKCPWKGCKHAFKWAWARTEHIRVHTGERPYVCPDCDQTFRFVSDFSRHKRNTGHTKS